MWTRRSHLGPERRPRCWFATSVHPRPPPLRSAQIECRSGLGNEHAQVPGPYRPSFARHRRSGPDDESRRGGGDDANSVGPNGPRDTRPRDALRRSHDPPRVDGWSGGLVPCTARYAPDLLRRSRRVQPAGRERPVRKRQLPELRRGDHIPQHGDVPRRVAELRADGLVGRGVQHSRPERAQDQPEHRARHVRRQPPDHTGFGQQRVID